MHHKANFNLFLLETLQSALLQAMREYPLFLSSVKDRNISTLYGQSEDDQATAGGKRDGVTAFGRPCPALPFVLSMPGEQGDIFGILF